MKHKRCASGGFTIVETVVGLVVLAIVALAMFSLFVALTNSTVISQHKAVALTLATNQMEYLKSLPYDNLAVQGGSIYSSNPLPATTTKVENGVTYNIVTAINYVDDAYDGCASYPTQQLKQLYCRNYPPPSGAPAVDTNPADYKVLDVTVSAPANVQLAEVDTEVAARVAETASSTGALIVSVLDNTGAALPDATVNIVDNSVSPAVNLSDDSDSNGNAIFYSLPPDTNNYHYVITASKSGYSTLTTIAPSGSLQPTYPSQNILVQKVSYVTLTIKQMGSPSLLIQATNTSGNPLPNTKIYVKGGYKKYTSTSDTSYYYDTLSPSDIRPVTDGNGMATISNLVPGPYYFCGDNGATSCSVGGTTYYLAAAVPYGGNSSFSPINVPTYDPGNPPSTTYPYNGTNYLQEVRLIFTTQSNFPRVTTLLPDNVSLSDGTLSSVAFSVTGANLPCSSNPSSCGTTVKLTQGSNTYTASCTGTTGAELNCTVNLTGVSAGNTYALITANGQTLTIPTGLLGGINVGP